MAPLPRQTHDTAADPNPTNRKRGAHYAGKITPHQGGPSPRWRAMLLRFEVLLIKMESCPTLRKSLTQEFCICMHKMTLSRPSEKPNPQKGRKRLERGRGRTTMFV